MPMNSTMQIPYHRPFLGVEEENEVLATLRSGWLTTGPKAKAFEAEFAEKMGFKYAVALNSATAALHLALEAIGLRRGEGVLVPAMTFAATAEVVRYFDAVPILVDCHEDFNIDVTSARLRVEAALKSGMNVRAIIPVHYGGLICDMLAIRQLAADYNLRVIEDAAHCCPAFYYLGDSKVPAAVGCESDVSCFSFYANKCITTGEGGMACTNDSGLADRMRIMSLHGISKDAWKRFTAEGSWYYEIVAPGYKYNLTDLAAAIGLAQLRKMDNMLRLRTEIASWYKSMLAGVGGIVLPECPANRVHSWHLYSVRILGGENVRNKLISDLKARQITTSVHWRALHLHPYYRTTYSYGDNDFPVATRLSSEAISLPIYPGMSFEECAYVSGAVKSLMGRS